MVKNYQNNLRKKNSPFYPLVSKAYYKDTKKKCDIGEREGEGEKEVGERGRNGPMKQKCT